MHVWSRLTPESIIAMGEPLSSSFSFKLNSQAIPVLKNGVENAPLAIGQDSMNHVCTAENKWTLGRSSSKYCNYRIGFSLPSVQNEMKFETKWGKNHFNWLRPRLYCLVQFVCVCVWLKTSLFLNCFQEDEESLAPDYPAWHEQYEDSSQPTLSRSQDKQ